MICLDDGFGRYTDDGIDALYFAILNERRRRQASKRKASRDERAASKVRRVTSSTGQVEIDPRLFLAVPGEHQSASSRSKYLEPLLLQDWSHLFQGGDTERRYCVYAHIDPRKERFATSLFAGGDYRGIPIYIGKGTIDRAFDLRRNQGHGKVLREIIAAGFCEQDIVKVIMQDMTEAKALEMESKLIYFFGTVYEKARKRGTLTNLDIPKRPEFSAVMGSMPSIQRASLHRQSTKGD